MGFSVNKVTLLGKLGRDAETRFTTSNVSVTNFSIATDHSYKNKKDDEWVKETTWHNLTGFNLSDFIKKKLKKGAQVYCEGRIQKREYTDKDGVKRYSVDVMVDPSTIIVLGETGRSSENEEATVEEPASNTGDGDLPF